MQNSTPIVAVINSTDLQALGLQETDLPLIQQVASQIQADNPLSVADFGHDVSEHTSSYTDSLLDQVRNRDLDEAGARLTQVVAVAQSVNINALTDRRSRIPVIGVLIDKLAPKTNSIMAQFDSTREQIDKLMAEVEQTQTGIASRNHALEQMYDGVREEHRLLGIHIAAGKQRLSELREQAQEMRAIIGNDPAGIQRLADLDHLISNLDKRVGDLIVLQHSAAQSLPSIRMIQMNNQLLIDKFHTIRTITVPAWKRQFTIALGLNEQRNAVQLANTIDDTTNELLRRNADLLYKNSVATAKANQRLVIDVETLQHVQTTLIKTVEEVIAIHKEGTQRRQHVEKQIHGMRLDMAKRIRGGQKPKELH